LSKILLEHGDGGLLTSRLVRDIFLKHLGRPQGPLEDSTIVDSRPRIAVTTDAFVVSPLWFRGGDIGKLAVSGTYNDLVVRGARPAYLTCSFIVEEGFETVQLEALVESLAAEARRARVSVVAGDTKVVQAGQADGLFIGASGIGFIEDARELGVTSVREGDAVVVTGDIGRHGATLMAARLGIKAAPGLASDCHSMTYLLDVACVPGVHCMRDITRGGVVTILCEIAESTGLSIQLDENGVLTAPETSGICRLLGLDPLYLPCEGRAVIFCEERSVPSVLETLRSSRESTGGEPLLDPRRAATVTGTQGIVSMVTMYSGTRRLSSLTGAQLPRMC